MKKIYLLSSLFGFLGFALLGSAQATVSIFEDHTTDPVAVFDSISTWETTGEDMTGMVVTVDYANSGGSETVYWDFGGVGTGAVGADWSLTMADSTKTTYFGSYWMFDVTDGGKAVESIFLNGIADNTIFDNVLERHAPDSTEGSESGNPLTIDLDLGGMPITDYVHDIKVTYIGDVALTSSIVNGDPVPVGDLYQGMLVEFDVNGDNKFSDTDTFYFYQDTDNIVNPVPEPTTILLFGVGLTGLVAMQARRKRR